MPIEVSEFSKDASIIAFAWEPKGIRFAVIHSEAGSNRTDVSLYTMGSKYNGKVSLLKTFEKKACNCLFWSPAGNLLLLANLKGTAGQLEWVDINTQQTIGEAEHFMCSDIEWDPTGRWRPAAARPPPLLGPSQIPKFPNSQIPYIPAPPLTKAPQ